PTASPRRSGNHLSAVPTQATFTAPAPRPPRAEQIWSAPMDCVRPEPIQLSPTRTPLTLTTSRAPKRSTRYPSTGTNQLAARLKIVKASWTAESDTLKLSVRGMVNRVQAYCRLEMASMALMQTARRNQRLATPSARAATTVSAIGDPPVPVDL